MAYNRSLHPDTGTRSTHVQDHRELLIRINHLEQRCYTLEQLVERQEGVIIALGDLISALEEQPKRAQLAPMVH
jgi:hypothetical protein